jgi:outer membrane lipoprotein-sorting protein
MDKPKGSIFISGLAFVCMALAQPVVAADADVERIVRSIDSLYRGASSRALVEMQIVTPSSERKLLLSVSTQGDERTFIRIKDPAKERGIGTLRLDNEIWNYLPRADETVRIPPSLLMNSWMGSDFTNDDLLKEYTFFRDHKCVSAQSADKQGNVLHIRCDPKPGLLVLWEYVLLSTDQATGLPLRQEFYDRDGKLMRSLVYSEVASLGGRTLPTVLKMMPADKSDQYTQIRYKELQYNLALPNDLFSRRYLESDED